MIERPDEGWYAKKIPFRFYVARTNWATKLSQLEHMNADQMVFITFSLSSDDRWMGGILEKMHNANMNTAIICNSKFADEAQKITEKYNIAVYHHENLHTKMVWFSNGIVWFGSQNFVKSSNIEFLARIKDVEVAEKIREEYINKLFASAETPHLRGRYGFVGTKCPECGDPNFVFGECDSCSFKFKST